MKRPSHQWWSRFSQRVLSSTSAKVESDNSNDRIDELVEAATKANLLDLVSNILGELDCLAICTSGVIEADEEERPATS